MLALAAAGCSSGDAPEPEPLLTAEETASAMPQIMMDEVLERLKKPRGKALLIVLWRADTEASSPCLAAADRLAATHAKAGLEVLALNIDMPSDVRERALPLLQKAGLKTRIWSYFVIISDLFRKDLFKSALSVIKRSRQKRSLWKAHQLASFLLKSTQTNFCASA